MMKLGRVSQKRGASVERTQALPNGRIAVFEKLEPRILLSADPLSAALDTSVLSSDTDAIDTDARTSVWLDTLKSYSVAPTSPDNAGSSTIDLTVAPPWLGADSGLTQGQSNDESMWDTTLLSDGQESQSRELIFIDAATPDYASLVEDATTSSDNVEIIMLSAERSGIEQVAQYLEGSGQGSVSAIHIISHGDGSGIQLGSLWLDASSLSDHATVLQDWSAALSPNADILLYGCNLAADESGRQLVQTIAQLTDADVAASDDLTGAASANGDWALEYKVGELETQVAFSAQLQQSWQFTLGPPGAVDALWLSSNIDVTGASAPGLSDWSSSEALEFADPNLSFDPAGTPADTTDGTFDSIIDLNNFAASGDVDINALHYVSADITVGQTTQFNLLTGDLLLSIDSNSEVLTSTNSLSVDKGDVFVFRPDAANDYSVGSFYMLLEDLASSSKDLQAISLVEQTTDVGGVELAAGSFLYSQQNDGSFKQNDVLVFDPTGVGAGTTSGNYAVLIDGAELGIDKEIRALELIESDTSIAGTSLSSGNILIAVKEDTIGDNSVALSLFDVAVLDITQATVGGASPLIAQGTAQLFFDGADVGFGTAEINALTLVSVSQNVEPTLTATANNPTFVEDGGPVAIFSAANIDTVEAGQQVAGLSLTITNVLDGSNERLHIDGSVIVLTDGMSGVTVGSGYSYQVTLNGSMITVVLSDGAQAVADAEAMINAMAYENVSENPVNSGRFVSLTSITDSGGTANGGDDTASINIGSSVPTVSVNDAPIATAIALDPSFSEGDAAVLLFTSADLSSVEADQSLSALTFTITNVFDGDDERFIFDAISVMLTDGNSGTTVTNGLAYSVSVAGNVATVSITGASLSNVQANTLVDELAYQNLSETPTDSDRVITLIEIKDSGGNTNGGVDTTALNLFSTVSKQAINDEPVVSASANNPTYVQGASAVLVFSGSAVDVIESGQSVTGFVLEVTNVVDGANEKLMVDGTLITLTGGSSGVTDDNSLSFSVSVAGTTRTVTFYDGVLTESVTESVIDSVTYQNDGVPPTVGNRNVSLIELSDSGGVDDGGDDTATLAISSVVDVAVSNVEPTFSATGENPTYVGGASAVPVFSGALVDTVEQGQTVIELSLTVSGLLDAGDEILSIDGTDVVLTNATTGSTLGHGISYVVSVVSDTATVTLSGASLSESEAQLLVDTLLYRNTLASPSVGDRIVTLTDLRDSGGVDNGGDDSVAVNIQSLVNVTTNNNEPIVTATPSNPVFTEGSGAVGLFTSTNIDVVEVGQQVIELSFTVTNVFDGANETLQVDGSSIALINANAGLTSINGLAYTVTVAANTATIDFISSGISSATAQSLVDAMGYQNASEQPNESDRIITFVSLRDSGGAVGGDDLASPNIVTTVSVVAQNDQPIAADVALAAQENGSTVSGSFVVTDADALDTHTFVITAAPSEGGVVNNGDGTFTFDPGGGFQDLAVGETRDVTFTYIATDSSGSGNANSTDATATVTVTGTNDQPVASAISIGANEDGAAVVGAFGVNDIDASDTHIYSITSAPLEGSVVNNNDGTFTYDPGSDFQDLAQGQTRDVSFTYITTDNSAAGNADSASAVVTVTVTGTNDQPLVGNIVLSAAEDGAAINGSFTVADQDSLDSHVFTIVAQPVEGSVVNNNDGTFSFYPGGDFQDLAMGETRVMTFTYSATDSSAAANAPSTVGVVSVTVTGTNDQPVASNMAINSVEEGTAVTRSFAVADIDDLDVLTYSIVSGPSQGSVVNNNDGTFTFNPLMAFQDLGAGESRTVSFTYQANDNSGAGNAASSIATAAVTVVGTNDQPVVSAINLAATEDADAVSAAFVVSDVDTNDTHVFTVLTPPPQGSVVNNGSGSFSFELGDDFQDLANGETRVVSFTYRANDDSGSANSLSDVQQVSVVVAGTNDRPQVSDVSIVALSGQEAVTGTFVVSDVDATDTHSFIVTTAPSQGSVVNLDDGTFQFILGDDFDDLNFGETRTITITYQSLDSAGLTSSVSDDAVIEIVVKSSNVVIFDPVISAPAVSEAEPASSEQTNTEPDNDSGSADDGGTEADADNGEAIAEQALDSSDGLAAASDLGFVFSGFDAANPDGVASSIRLETVATQAFVKPDNTLPNALGVESVESLRAQFALYSDPLALLESNSFMRGVDQLNEQLEDSGERRDDVVGGLFAVSAGLSAGYVVWLARSGVLLSSVLSSLPAWRFIDPLPVLSSMEGAGVGAAGDDESLEDIVNSPASTLQEGSND